MLQIKTTSPDKYRVRPSTASLPPGDSCTIEIYVQSAQAGSAASLVRDKFLITASSVEAGADLTPQRVAELMKAGRPDASYRLRCVLAAAVDGGAVAQRVSYNKDGNFGAAASAGDLTSVVQKQAEQIDKMGKKVNKRISRRPCVIRLFI